MKKNRRDLKRSNLGLRATPEVKERLRMISQARGTTVQGLFDELIPQLVSEPARDGEPGPPAAAPGGSKWSQLFLKNLPAAAVIKNLDLKFVWVNEGYMAMTHKSAGDLLGKGVGDNWATRDSAQLIETNDRVVLDQKRATVQIETVKDHWGKTQERFRIRFPIYDDKGEVEYLGAIGFDYQQIENVIRKKDAE
jgi:PAS domain-containing protein